MLNLFKINHVSFGRYRLLYGTYSVVTEFSLSPFLPRFASAFSSLRYGVKREIEEELDGTTGKGQRKEERKGGKERMAG